MKKRILELRSEGKKYKEIASILNNEGYKSDNGRTLTASIVNKYALKGNEKLRKVGFKERGKINTPDNLSKTDQIILQIKNSNMETWVKKSIIERML